MDLQEKRRLDAERLTGQLAHARARTRPWRSIIALILALAAAVASYVYSSDHGLMSLGQKGKATATIFTAGCAAAFFVLAVIAVAGLAGKARKALEPRVGSGHAAVVRYTILLTGGLATLVITLELLKIHLGKLLVGAGLTAVILGIAAQQSLANLFAGLVLLLSRPFAVGERIRVRSGAMGGPLEGTVTEIGITYLRLDTGDGILALPNAQVLAAAVGPAPLQPAPVQPPEQPT